MTVPAENSWLDWRQAVVAVIRADLSDVLEEVTENDVDWEAWRPLYEEGRSPRAAVDRAFELVDAHSGTA
jgi:hypothetical protein